MKSGLEAKSVDHVLFPQVWPHSVLQDEFVCKDLKFFELNFKQFVAGELEIISNTNTPMPEHEGRLSFLKLLSYHANSSFKNKHILEWYASWVRKIELGQRTWGDDPREL